MHFDGSDLANSEISRDGSKKVKHRRTASKSSKKVSKPRTSSTSGPRNRSEAPGEEPGKIKRTSKKSRGKPSSSADPQQPGGESGIPPEVGQEDGQRIAKPGSALNIDTCPKKFRESNVHHLLSSKQVRQSTPEVCNNVHSKSRSPRSHPQEAGNYDAFEDAAVKVEHPSTFQPLRSASKYSSQERMTQMKQEFDQKLAPAQNPMIQSKDEIMSQIKNEINSIDEEICDLRHNLQQQIKNPSHSPIINITAKPLNHMANPASFSQLLEKFGGNVALFSDDGEVIDH